MTSDIQLRFDIEKPLNGIDFGIQKGKGKDYETIQTQRSKGQNLTFEFSIPVHQKNGQPNFTGPISQGPPSGRFVYVDIGKYAGQTGTDHGARMKVPLGDITWDMVEEVVGSADGFLEARLPGDQTATTHPFGGWKIVKK